MKSAVEYLSVFPSIFIKLGRKFSFRNPMFSYLNAPSPVFFHFQSPIMLRRSISMRPSSSALRSAQSFSSPSACFVKQ